MRDDPSTPNPTPAPLRRWVNTRTAAEHLGVHPEVLRRWARQPGQHTWLPKPIRVGREFRWDIDELESALANSGGEPPEHDGEPG
ncbi:helix-turn-helix domain-containing protein [Nocardia neocaledoniensis]|uniref:helix-turn-helix domain-containing protein n=1 Tax=Nocardia neocaledoniensis TaxID=236511 RepID=UPI0011B51D58|nr:helix-turn-helix domain-containing protein [Nocardia neocaledoniensis]